MSDCVLTFSDTGTVTGLLPAPDEVIVTEPLYVPAPSEVTTPAFIETLRFPGVVPPPDTASQAPPEDVEADAEKFRAEPVLPTAIDCGDGTLPPVVNANAREPGAAVRLGAAVTVSVTGICSGLLVAPAAVTVIVPE